MKAETVPPTPPPEIVLTMSPEEAETLLHHAYRTLPGTTFNSDLTQALESALGMSRTSAKRLIK